MKIAARAATMLTKTPVERILPGAAAIETVATAVAEAFVTIPDAVVLLPLTIGWLLAELPEDVSVELLEVLLPLVLVVASLIVML